MPLIRKRSRIWASREPAMSSGHGAPCVPSCAHGAAALRGKVLAQARALPSPTRGHLCHRARLQAAPTCSLKGRKKLSSADETCRQHQYSYWKQWHDLHAQNIWFYPFLGAVSAQIPPGHPCVAPLGKAVAAPKPGVSKMPLEAPAVPPIRVMLHN